MFTETAELYDRFYDWKDYPSEAERIHELVTARAPGARSLLDVACGTGRHLELLRAWYQVEGLDLDPRLLAVARRRLGDVPLHEGDMTDFDLGRTFDIVTCLFSSIGYVRTVERLELAVKALAHHVAPGGVLLVEPWFSPDQFLADHMGAVIFIDEPELKAVRMNGSRRDGTISIFEFHYLIERPATVEHRTETHTLGLFTDDEYRGALEAAGLGVEHDPDGLMGRGLWIGTKAA